MIREFTLFLGRGWFYASLSQYNAGEETSCGGIFLQERKILSQEQRMRQLSSAVIVSRQKFVSTERLHELIPENPQSKHNADSFRTVVS